MRLPFLFFLGLATAQLAAQEPTPKPAQPAAVLDPITPTPPGEPVLPQEAGFPVDVNNYENPLLLFQGEKRDLPMANEEDLELLPPISPYLPGEQPPEGSPEKPLTPEDLELRAMGMKVAASVVGIRVWDEFGNQISSGIGSFVTTDGIILTDTGLLHPEIAEKVDYITITGADGSNHKITGFYVADLVTGVTLLQSEGRDTQPLELSTNV
ncbi:MAG: hypothetical protein OJI67_11110, partial [Prosthecobacter sp.]|nr:hypothetical protein [Prosthecobacter sp.]